jgi:hypothetical protein
VLLGSKSKEAGDIVADSSEKKDKKKGRKSKEKGVTPIKPVKCPG